MQTLRADISYGFAEADTTYGKLGIKVWVNKGEVFGREDVLADAGKEDDAKKKNRRRAPKKEA